MKKKALIFALVTGLLVFGAASSQAAQIEFQMGGVALPALTEVLPGSGPLAIDVVLTDAQGVADIDGFNLWVEATGAGANTLTGDPNAQFSGDFIFPSTFAYFVTPTTPLQVSASASAVVGTTGVVPGLLAQLTFGYAGNAGEIYTLGLVDATQNFGSSATGPDFSLDLTDLGQGVFNPQVEVVPIPAAAWLLGSGLLALVGLRRKLR